MDRLLTPTGVGTRPLPSLNSAIVLTIELLYWEIPLSETPITDKYVALSERNRQICARYEAGEKLEAIAKDLGISYQRVHQLIHRWCG